MGLTFTERRSRINVLGWPTDVISIDPNPNDLSCEPDARRSPVHTILFWIPGNPGQHDWYNSDFMDVLSGLGEGYAIRSVSHAGHGLFGKSGGDYENSNHTPTMDVEEYCRDNAVTGSASPLVPWTVEGQVLHKIAYIDNLLSSIKKDQRRFHAKDRSTHKEERSFQLSNDLKFIMIGHSFGCHVIQRMCVMRPDILERVSGYLFLMPYTRTKPSSVMDQRKLDFAGSRSEMLIRIGTKLSRTVRYFPDSMLRTLVRSGLRDGSDSGGNDSMDGENQTIVNVTAKILGTPSYPRNFFELGTEEIRDIPNEMDVAALRLLSSPYRRSLPQKAAEGESRLERPRTQQQQKQKRQDRPIFILYAGDKDQWCPSFHGQEIKVLQSANLLPRSIQMTKMTGLRHDYVCMKRSKRARVNDWIISNINKIHNKNGFVPGGQDDTANDASSTTRRSHSTSTINTTTSTTTSSVHGATRSKTVVQIPAIVKLPSKL